MAQTLILIAIVAYLLFMLWIGFRCAKKNSSVDDFYLGGRKLGPLVTAMSAEEIAALPGVPAKRADVLGGGAVLYCVLMDKLGFSQIVVSDSDNLEGYAKKHGLL